MEYRRAVLDLDPRLRSCAAAAVLLLFGCGDGAGLASDAGTDAAPVARRVKPRTVNFEIFKTGERVLEKAADGSFQYGALTDIGGVLACVAQRRDAFAHFQDFVPLEEPICTTSVEGELVRFEHVPASSDLILTFTKDGYEPVTLTFRTDEYDVSAPLWAASVSLPFWRDGTAEPWLEAEPARVAGNGAVVIWATAFWSGEGTVQGEEQLATLPLPNATFSEGVTVAIEDANQLSVVELRTLRERPLWVSLPAGRYRFRFSHPRMKVRPAGATIQFMAAGLPTDQQDTIEVPVLAGHNAVAYVDAFCAPPWGHGVGAEDLATCTLTPATHAGIP